MRSCVPASHTGHPRVQDVDSLLQIIAAAEDAYQQLIAEHVDLNPSRSWPTTSRGDAEKALHEKPASTQPAPGWRDLDVSLGQVGSAGVIEAVLSVGVETGSDFV